MKSFPNIIYNFADNLRLPVGYIATELGIETHIHPLKKIILSADKVTDIIFG